MMLMLLLYRFWRETQGQRGDSSEYWCEEADLR